jgi:hypothetical protein
MSEVYDVEDREGWAFTWQNPRGRFELEWLPHKAQWQRAFRVGDAGGWSMQALDGLETPFDHTDARRIAKAHAAGCDLP